MLSCTHEYFILDGRAKHVHKFHFVFLNHFRHKDRIFFPFYLRFSLLHSLQAHRKKESHSILHEGLILLIENYCKNKAMVSSPPSKKKKGYVSKTYSRKSKGEEGVSGKRWNLKKETPQKNVEEIIESDNLDKNEEKKWKRRRIQMWEISVLIWKVTLVVRAKLVRRRWMKAMIKILGREMLVKRISIRVNNPWE